MQNIDESFINDRFCSLDWLGFTYHPLSMDVGNSDSILKSFLNEFPEFNFDDFVEADWLSRKKLHYTKVFLFNEIIVGYNPLDPELSPSKNEAFFRQGVNVQVSSSNLCMLANLLNIDTNASNYVAALLSELDRRSCSFSRIDICWDDYNRVFTPDYYSKAYFGGYMVTPFTGTGIGKTGFYLGSLKARKKLLRIYDKFVESKGEVNSIRYEFEYHTDDAQALGQAIIHEFPDGIPFSDLLYRWLKIKDASVVDNYNRPYDAPDDDIWFKAIILNLTLSYPLIFPKYEKGISEESITYWVKSKAYPSIAGYIKCFGWNRFREEMRELIKNDKISARYQTFYTKLKACNELFADDSIIDNPFIY